MPRLHPGQSAVRKHPARFKVLACGRRWGKTRLGTALCVEVALRGGRAWWVAPSYKMAAVGWRGLRMLTQQIPGAEINRAERLLTFPTKGTVQVRSADDPQSLRGEGLDLVVLDECAYTKEAAWTEALRPALSDRKGAALFISTPHGINWFRDLWLRGNSGDFDDWKSWTFKTRDNPYIDPDEIEAARATLLSRIFRQEYEADFLEDNPGALWKREWLDVNRVLKTPQLFRVGVAMDPASTSKRTSDDCGIIGGGIDGVNGFVLEDATVHGTPTEQARAAITLYHKLEADVLIVEANNGGEWIPTVIHQIDSSVNVKIVHASRGKVTRAEPVSALDEQGRIHHVGTFPLLEDELCQWEPGDASPNRLDARVWLFTELMLDVQVPAAHADPVDMSGSIKIERGDRRWQTKNRIRR